MHQPRPRHRKRTYGCWGGCVCGFRAIDVYCLCTSRPACAVWGVCLLGPEGCVCEERQARRDKDKDLVVWWWRAYCSVWVWVFARF